jgi:CHAD domain-containing protein
MNIFYLDKNPVIAAQMSCDKHVVKMILETAQLLSTAHRVLDGKEYIDARSGRRIKRWKLRRTSHEKVVYKATHVNHPSAKWARVSRQNYLWLYEHFLGLCAEYTWRYGKVHLCQTKLSAMLCNEPKNISDYGKTQMPQAMPDYCKERSSVQAYRNYYINEKYRLLQYTNREPPTWLEDCVVQRKEINHER